MVGAGPATRPSGRRSARFSWYQDALRLTLVVGEQEGKEVDRALAIGLAEREDRDLVLVLPRGWHEPTVHRWAWLDDSLQISVWTHENSNRREPTTHASGNHGPAAARRWEGSRCSSSSAPLPRVGRPGKAVFGVMEVTVRLRCDNR